MVAGVGQACPPGYECEYQYYDVPMGTPFTDFSNPEDVWGTPEPEPDWDYDWITSEAGSGDWLGGGFKSESWFDSTNPDFMSPKGSGNAKGFLNDLLSSAGDIAGDFLGQLAKNTQAGSGQGSGGGGSSGGGGGLTGTAPTTGNKSSLENLWPLLLAGAAIFVLKD